MFASLLRHRDARLDPHVVIHVDPEQWPGVDQFREAGQCDVVPFDTGWRENFGGQRRLSPQRIAVAARFLKRRTDVTKVVRRFDPHVVYSSQQHFDCRLATYVAGELETPQIVHLHYGVGDWLRRPVLERLLTCDHVIAVSDFIRSDAISHGVDESRVTTIHNTLLSPLPVADGDPAELRRALGVPPEAFVYGMASRIATGKGHVDAVRAFDILAESRNDSWLVIAGTGPVKDELRTVIAASRARNRVMMLGHRTDIASLLSCFDVFVHPSRNEPFGLAVLEALSVGLPVVAYREGGTVELVESGVCGLLADPGDVASLSDAMGKLYDDPELLTSTGAAAKRRVAERFRPEAASRAFADVVYGIVTAR